MEHIVTQEMLTEFLEKCQKIMDEYRIKNFGLITREVLVVQMGRRNAKIVRKPETLPQKGGSAWAFIDMTNGDVLKPASWNTPARHARGNLFDDQKGMGMIGPYGPAYLK
jgi:hypothetical protein